MTHQIDPSIHYSGPRAEFASLTGSPFWGLHVNEVVAAAQARGWVHQSGQRLPTPYGLGPLLHHFITPGGRSVIWIPSYGDVRGEDTLLHRHVEKTFWLLWQAGVKVLMVGGTSGVADWRTGDDAVRPGDIVLPWSFRTRPGYHRGLPGTLYETFWPDHDVLLGDPFCPVVAKPLAEKFRNYVKTGQIRRVHTPAEARVALVIPDAPTFETDFDILVWLSISRMSSQLQPHKPPVITLHGDCVNPVLARHLGIHLMYYHMVSNYAQGLGDDLADTLYGFYLKTFPQIALEVEFSLLETVAIPNGQGCQCLAGVHQAPAVFRSAMTQKEDQ